MSNTDLFPDRPFSDKEFRETTRHHRKDKEYAVVVYLTKTYKVLARDEDEAAGNFESRIKTTLFEDGNEDDYDIVEWRS